MLGGRRQADPAASVDSTKLEKSISVEHMAALCYKQGHRQCSQRLVFAEGASLAMLQHPGNECKSIQLFCFEFKNKWNNSKETTFPFCKGNVLLCFVSVGNNTLFKKIA